MLRDALVTGRQVLVLSDRVDHLKGIAKWAKEEIPQFKTMLYIGATKQEERDKAGDYDLILGTMSLAKEVGYSVIRYTLSRNANGKSGYGATGGWKDSKGV